MITPKFHLEQTDEFVVVHMKTPYIKAQELEISMIDNEFRFYCKPYFLRLLFDQELAEETGEEKAKYDVDSGDLTLWLPKKNAGELFTSLDMLTKLLRKPSEDKVGGVGRAAAAAMGGGMGIQVLSSTDNEEDGDEAAAAAGGMRSEPLEPIDFDLPQSLPEEPILSIEGAWYGFNNAYSKVFCGYEGGELSELLLLQDPEAVREPDRKNHRIQAENEKFDSGQYLFDTLENKEEINEMINFECPWTLEYKKKAKNEIETAYFTEEEREALMKLPKKEFLLDAAQVKKALVGLVDILFSMAYDKRTTLGEGTVESGWTVWALSSSLSFLDVGDTVTATLIANYRRSLCYPLYRSWDLTRRIHRDVLVILRNGNKCVLRWLIQCAHALRICDRDILNRIYINDYMVWIQSVHEETMNKWLSSLSEAVAAAKISKDDMGWDLKELEQAAEEQHMHEIEEEDDEDDDDDDDDDDENN